MLRGTVIACCLATTWGLAVDSQRLHVELADNGTTEAQSCSNGTVRRAAMCLAGNARTFGDADVVSSLEGFLRSLQADQSCNPARVDLFAYVTLTGDKRKEERGSRSQVNSSKQAVEDAFAMLNATAFQAVDTAGDITTTNFHKYVVGSECFRNGYWSNTRRFIRSLNQLRHAQQCLQQVIQHEVQVGAAYDVVMIARPDMIYNDEARWRTLVMDTASQGLMHHKKDWFLALPRSVVNTFFDPNRSLPLTCRPGDHCCGRVQRSEDMFEYITEAHLMGEGNVCTCKQCYCAQDFPVVRRSSYVDAGFLATLGRPPPLPKHVRGSHSRSLRRHNQSRTGHNGTRSRHNGTRSRRQNGTRSWHNGTRSRRHKRTRSRHNQTRSWHNQSGTPEPEPPRRLESV